MTTAPVHATVDAPAARAASDWLGSHGLPSSREESWRYTPVDEIVAKLERTGAASSTAELPVPLDASAIERLAGDHGGPRLVFVNGAYSPELSSAGPAEVGVRVGPIDRGDPIDDPIEAEPDDTARFDGFQALNRIDSAASASVVIDAGAQLVAPIHVVHVTVPSDGYRAGAVHTNTLVDAGERSRATIIETYLGTDVDAVTNACTSIRVGADAVLTHHRIQADSPDAVHVGHTRIEQAARSRFRTVSVMLGASIARHAIDLTFREPDAHAQIDGVYLPSGRQRHDNIVTVDHAASRCTSVQRLKGVVDDTARGSFGGHVIVRSGTVGTDADQSNRNLLLTRTAQADTRPWLEIYADDVKCTHGATVGRLDDDALFYLRSRGIAVDEARKILIEAFVAEIVDTLTPMSLRDHLRATIAERTGATS